MSKRSGGAKRSSRKIQVVIMSCTRTRTHCFVR